MSLVDKKNRSIEGVAIDELIREFGSPLFVVSERIIQKKYEDFKTALEAHYQPFKISYSFKTNNVPGICAMFRKQGSMAEVVSSFEYWLAKTLGFSGEQIIFNGPYKTDNDLHVAIHDCCILNIDNRDELLRLVRIAKQNHVLPAIGLRVNTREARPDSHAWNRFGFNIENGEARELCKEIKNYDHPVRIMGLHLHLGTNIADAAVYGRAAKKLVAFASECERILQTKIDYLDFGGGFAIKGNTLKGNKTILTSSMEDYVMAITKELYQNEHNHPLLIFEPGRWLVAESTTLFTTVISVKDLAGTPSVTTDASVNILREAAYLDFEIEAIKNKSGIARTRVYGCTCMQSDILGDAMLPVLTEGDILAIHDVGAYSIPRSSQWMFPRPAIVCITKEGEIRLLRRVEVNNDLIRLDIL